MDESKEKRRIKRFSSENWDIINSLKQQTKELQEFEDQFERSTVEISGQDVNRQFNDCESLASCDYTACLPISFGEEISSASKYQSCLDYQFSKHSVEDFSKHLEQERTEGNKIGSPNDNKSETEVNMDDKLPITERVFAIFVFFAADQLRRSSKEYPTPPSIMQALLRKLKRFQNANNENLISDNKSRITSSEPLQRRGNRAAASIAEHAFDQTSSQTSAALHCLMSIDALRKYFRGISLSCLDMDNTESPQKPSQSSLKHFIKVFKLHRKSKTKEYQPELIKLTKLCQNTEIKESCFEALKRILASLHEEIIVAKKTGKIKRTCLRRCRQSTRSNHSIVSHIFRGHLKKRAECPCGHINIRHEPFTSLPLSFSSSDNKTLVIPLTSYNAGGRCTVQKYLLRFNQWTTIGNLKSKLYTLNPKIINRIVIASVKDNDILFIHDTSSSVFDAMCKEGELQAFETFESNHDCGTTKEECEDTDYPYTSTPAITDISDIEDQGRESHTRTLSANNTPRNELLAVPVVFKLHSHLTDDEILSPPAFIYLPKLIDGGKFSRVCSRLLGISECDASRIYVSIKTIQDERCLLCSEISCSGCHLKASRTIALGPTCKIVTYINPAMENRVPEILEHSTLISGTPANIFSVEEGLKSFRKQDSNVICSACGIRQQVEVTTSIISYPDVLVITIDRNNMKDVTLTYPHLGFAPALSKSVKNRKIYNLSGTITSKKTSLDDNREVIQYNFSGTAIKKPRMSGAGMIEDQNIPKSDMEILIYSRPETTIEKGRKKKATHHNINKQHRKKRVNTLSSSFQNDEQKEVTCPSKPNEITRNVSTTSCFSDGRSQKTTIDDETASVCNCPRCQCLQKCAEQIRGSASTSIENLKLDEGQLNKLKESVSTSTNPTVLLHRAILKQDLRRAVSLLKRGSDPNDLVDGIAAIHLAAGLQLPMGYFFTKLLIDHGADPNKKTIDGVTPVQLASMWNRSETLRFLSFHGGDLSSANDILEVPRRTNSTLSSVYSQTACTPKDSPAKPRNREKTLDSPNYSEADLRLKSLIHLQRSLRENHEMFQEATGPADNLEHLKTRIIDFMKETKQQCKQTEDMVTEGAHQSTEVNACGITEMMDSQHASDTELDQEFSDFSFGYMSDSVIPEVDEVDFATDLNSSTIPQAPSSVDGSSQRTVLSTLDEGNETVIIYSPKSQINYSHSRWPYYLCCGRRPRNHRVDDCRTHKHRASRVVGGVGRFFGRKIERCREFIDALRGHND